MTADRTIRAELYLRNFSTAADEQRELVRRLESFAGDGVIDHLQVERWSDRVDLVEADETVEAFERFREWAEQQAYSITPPFAVRTYRSAFTGDVRDVLVTPVMFLATYADGELEGVFPHRRPDGTVRTIDDFLASVERRTGQTPSVEDQLAIR